MYICIEISLECVEIIQLIGLKAALYSKQQAAKRDKTNSAPRNDSHTRKVSDKVSCFSIHCVVHCICYSHPSRLHRFGNGPTRSKGTNPLKNKR